MKRREVRRAIGAIVLLMPSTVLAGEAFVSQAPVRDAQRTWTAIRSTASDRLSVPLPIASLAQSLPQGEQNRRPSSGNSSYLTQNGMFNAAAVIQTGGQNLSAIIQQGRSNTASVVQSNGSR